MKVKVVLSVITILVGVAGFGFFQSYQAHAMHDSTVPNLNDVEQAEILSATLQIEISVPVDASGKKLVKVDGLGSMVWDGEETLLVTHNHWGEVLQEKSVVAFYDAQGQMVKTLSGSKFISLVRYLDAGTLILRSPVRLKEQTQLVIAADPLQVQVGDVVQVTQRGGPERKEAALVEAEVESITSIRGLPVIRLKGLEGRPVKGGDSGGGIWYEGSLVGNMWYTAIAKSTGLRIFTMLKPGEASVEATDESYAAIFPTRQLEALQGPLGGVDARGMSAVP